MGNDDNLSLANGESETHALEYILRYPTTIH